MGNSSAIKTYLDKVLSKYHIGKATKQTYRKKFPLLISTIILLSFLLQSCVVGLNKYGASVRSVQDKINYKCKFITTVTGSGSWGTSSAHDAEGAMNEIRNRVAEVGGNAFKILNIDSDAFTSTVVAEALKCEFND